MPRPKLPEQRELERIEAGIQVKIHEKERELETLRKVLEAIQEAIGAVADVARNPESL
jgi:hypothetical protein